MNLINPDSLGTWEEFKEELLKEDNNIIYKWEKDDKLKKEEKETKEVLRQYTWLERYKRNN